MSEIDGWSPFDIEDRDPNLEKKSKENQLKLFKNYQEIFNNFLKNKIGRYVKGGPFHEKVLDLYPFFSSWLSKLSAPSNYMGQGSSNNLQELEMQFKNLPTGFLGIISLNWGKKFLVLKMGDKSYLFREMDRSIDNNEAKEAPHVFLAFSVVNYLLNHQNHQLNLIGQLNQDPSTKYIISQHKAWFGSKMANL